MDKDHHGRLSLRSIETFIAVVEEGSVSRGAKRLSASVSSVSLRLSNLEKALDTVLLERNAQRFSITEAGHLFRHRALRILDEIDGAKSDLTSRHGSPHFALRMAIVEDFDNHVLPGWLIALQKEFPNARFITKSGPSHENFSILESRSADLIIAVDAMDPTDWIEEHPLMKDPYILVASPQVPDHITAQELMKFPFVRYAREQHMGRQIEAQLRRVKLVPPQQHAFSSNQALFSIVSELEGWAISTVSAVHGTLSHRHREAMDLTFKPLPFPTFSRTVSLYARRDILSEVPNIAARELRHQLTKVFDPGSQRLELPQWPEILKA